MRCGRITSCYSNGIESPHHRCRTGQSVAFARWRQHRPSCRGVVLKKKWGTHETRLRQRSLNNLSLHTFCTEIILHCVSVSNQLQQWTNFCTNFSPKKLGEWGTRPPCRKKWETPSPCVPAPLHPCSQRYATRSRSSAACSCRSISAAHARAQQQIRRTSLLLSVGGTYTRTDRRTDTRPLHRPCTTYYTDSVKVVGEKIALKRNETSNVSL